MLALASNRRRLSLLQKVPGETLPALPSLVDQSMIQHLVLCAVDTAILAVLSAVEQNMHSVGSHVLPLEVLQCCPISHLLCLAIQLFLFCVFTCEAAEIARTSFNLKD